VVVLDASPIEEIRNTEAIHLVVHHGQVVDRDALLAAGAPRTELLPYVWARTLAMNGRERLILGGVLVLLAAVVALVVIWRRRRIRRRRALRQQLA
jgi:type II secretory pathway component PulM